MTEQDNGSPDDRSPYSSERPRTLVAVIILALVLIAGAAAYFVVFGTGLPTGASVPLR